MDVVLAENSVAQQRLMNHAVFLLHQQLLVAVVLLLVLFENHALNYYCHRHNLNYYFLYHDHRSNSLLSATFYENPMYAIHVAIAYFLYLNQRSIHDVYAVAKNYVIEYVHYYCLYYGPMEDFVLNQRVFHVDLTVLFDYVLNRHHSIRVKYRLIEPMNYDVDVVMAAVMY